jgi:hypothetical protein
MCNSEETNVLLIRKLKNNNNFESLYTRLRNNLNILDYSNIIDEQIKSNSIYHVLFHIL